MKEYELLFMIPNKFTDNEVPGIIEDIEKILKDHGSEIVDTQNLGKKKLAYPIQHFNHAYYVLVNFNVEGAKTLPINNKIKLENNILRHLIVERIETGVSQEKLEELKKAYEKPEMSNEKEKSDKPERPERKVENKKVEEKTEKKVEETTKEEKSDLNLDKDNKSDEKNLKKLDEKLNNILEDIKI
jgi:small subunit ribosomal protein S6